MNPMRAEQRLSELIKELEKRGQEDLVPEVERVLDDIRAEGQATDLMTTGAAAAALGVKSINTIKNWVKEGRLEGVHRGGRMMITARSVNKLRESPETSEWVKFQKELDQAFHPFMAPNQEGVPSVIPWTSRKPWDKK